MADRLQYAYFLLQPIGLRSPTVPVSLFEPFHCILHACNPLNAQVHGSEMPFAQLLQYPILLAKCTSISVTRVIEQASCLIQDRDLVPVLELAALIPSNDGLIHKGSVAREVFNECHTLAFFGLIEDNAMAIRDCRKVQLAI